jgi:RND family efflux transporter MFP subunit
MNKNPLRAALVLGLLLLAACGDRGAFVPPPPPQVTVSQPVRRPVVSYLEFTGNTKALNTVQLRARVAGYLEKVLFQDGDIVKKDQPLFIIQQNTYEAQLKEAEADLLAAKAKLKYAETQVERFTRLVKQKAAAESDLDNWVFQRDAGKAAVLAGEAKKVLAALNLSYTRVTAPFHGRMDRRLKDPGNLVGAGEDTVLANINQIDPIYVYFTINELDLLRVRGDRPKHPDDKKIPLYMALATDTGYPHEGHLDFAAITLDPATGTLTLRGIFPNPHRKIMPGLFARLKAPVAEEKPQLLAPQAALSYDQLGAYLLVVNDRDVVERKNVKPGPLVDDLRVIDEGLTGSERVIVIGLLRAIPGHKVKPEVAGK